MKSDDLPAKKLAESRKIVEDSPVDTKYVEVEGLEEE